MTGTKLVVVLGMHRSGTSAITRALEVMHVDLGDRLMPPNEQINARGFWEDLDIYDLNVEMLHALDTEWYQASLITEADVQTLCTQGFLLKAVELLRRKMARAEMFGFKDPRLGRMLPFWQEVFRHDSLDVRYILALRNPMSVAASLRKRDGFETLFSYLLWLVHTVGSVAGSSDRPRVVVDFDRLMQDPRVQLQRIAALVEREVDPQAMDAFAGEFLSDELRHSTFRVDDLRVDPQCPRLVSEYFAALVRAAAGECELDAQPFVDLQARCSKALDDMAPAIRAMDRLQTEAMALRAAAREQQGRTAELEDLRRQLSQSADQSAQLQQQLSAAEGRVNDITVENERRSALVLDLQGALTSQTEAAAQAQRQCEERSARVAELEQELAQQREQTAQAQQQLSAAQSGLDALREENGRQAAAMLEQQEALASRSESWAQSQRLVEEHRARILALEQELAQQREQIAQAQQQLSAAQSRLDGLSEENSRQAAAMLEQQEALASRSESWAQSQRQLDAQISRVAELESELVQKNLLLDRSQEHAAQRDAEQLAMAQTLQDMQHRLDEMSRRAERAENENRAMRATWLWKLAAPWRPASGTQPEPNQRALLDR